MLRNAESVGNGHWMAKIALLSLPLFSVNALATTYDLRSYFESLPSTYPAQSATDQWTFYAGNGVGGSLLPPYGADYYNYPAVLYQQIGSLVDVGTNGCSPGYCPANTLATFNGVFVHPGSASPTSVVFRAQTAQTVTELKLWSEMVGNGHYGNGFDVTVRSYTGGGYHAIGSFTFDYPSTLATYQQTIFSSPITLGIGEFIEISYGNNGNYLYDHGNINAFVTTGPAGPTGLAGAAVPEPGTYTMILAGLGLLGFSARRQKAKLQQ